MREDDVKMDLKVTGCEDVELIQLSQDTVQRRNIRVVKQDRKCPQIENLTMVSGNRRNQGTLIIFVTSVIRMTKSLVALVTKVVKVTNVTI
jgi:hypothetical protein